MSGIVCAMSGEAPKEAAMSKKSGLVFERSLIEKYIQDHGSCPITGDALSLEDIMELKGNCYVKGRPVKSTSIPGMLSMFQDEWQETVRECVVLRKLLEQTRQELSHTLYQHDAACRVISRLVKERDEAREALVKASAKGEIFSSIATTAPNGVQSASFSDAMELDDGEGISEAVKVKMTEMSTILSKSRKKREVSSNLNSEEQISRYIQKKAFPVHMANAILCLDLHPSRENLTVTGGADNKVVIFDQKSEQAIHKIAAHSKKVTRVQFHPTQELLFSTSSDKTVKVWSTASGDNVYTFKDHRGEVTGVTLHATGDYIVSASHDKTWALHDLALGKCRKVVSDPSVTCGYSAASFHPDGLILGTATVDKLVRVWDVKTQQNVVTFSAHPGEVNCINFSENGYYVCTAGGDGFKMWDLRKVAKMSGQAVPVKHFSGDGEGNDAVFDYSGLYLACAGATSLEVYHTKSLNQVLSLPKAHSKSLTGVRFGPDAQFIVTASKDRELKFFSS